MIFEKIIIEFLPQSMSSPQSLTHLENNTTAEAGNKKIASPVFSEYESRIRDDFKNALADGKTKGLIGKDEKMKR